MTTIQGAILMIFTFICGIISKKWGRKIILFVGTFTIFISLVGLGISAILKDYYVENEGYTPTSI